MNEKCTLQTVYDKSEHCLPGQNGIWVKCQHFWPKNDGEKWSRKVINDMVCMWRNFQKKSWGVLGF